MPFRWNLFLASLCKITSESLCEIAFLYSDSNLKCTMTFIRRMNKAFHPVHVGNAQTITLISLFHLVVNGMRSIDPWCGTKTKKKLKRKQTNENEQFQAKLLSFSQMRIQTIKRIQLLTYIFLTRTNFFSLAQIHAVFIFIIHSCARTSTDIMKNMSLRSRIWAKCVWICLAQRRTIHAQFGFKRYFCEIPATNENEFTPVDVLMLISCMYDRHYKRWLEFRSPNAFVVASLISPILNINHQYKQVSNGKA